MINNRNFFTIERKCNFRNIVKKLLMKGQKIEIKKRRYIHEQEN